MFPTSSRDKLRLFTEALAVLSNSGSSSEDELLSVLTTAHSIKQLIEQVEVEAVAELGRRGTFTRYGNRKPETTLRDLTGIARGPSTRLVTAARTVVEHVGSEGETLPPILPATAAAFTAGRFGVQQVAVAANLIESPAAQRLPPDTRGEVEIEIARLAGECGPRKLRRLGTDVIARADPDSPDRPKPQVNRLRIIQHPGGGGNLDGTFTDPVRFTAILAVIVARSMIPTEDDIRTTAERQADALVGVCAHVAEHDNGEIVPDRDRRAPRSADPDHRRMPHLRRTPADLLRRRGHSDRPERRRPTPRRRDQETNNPAGDPLGDRSPHPPIRPARTRPGTEFSERQTPLTPGRRWSSRIVEPGDVTQGSHGVHDDD